MTSLKTRKILFDKSQLPDYFRPYDCQAPPPKFLLAARMFALYLIMPGYNLQISSENQFITDFALFPTPAGRSP